MIASMRHRRRSLPILLAGVGLLTVASACADRGTGEAAAPSSGKSSAAPSPAAEEESALSPEDELAAGLLPPEAFGPDAQVVTVEVRQLTTSGSGGLPAGGTITPPECGQSVGSTQLTPEDFGVVAQTATTGTGVTVQVPAESEQVDGQEPQFDELVDRCPEVTVDLPDGTRATITSTDVEVPELGDTSDGVAFTTAVQGADGTA